MLFAYKIKTYITIPENSRKIKLLFYYRFFTFLVFLSKKKGTVSKKEENDDPTRQICQTHLLYTTKIKQCQHFLVF